MKMDLDFEEVFKITIKALNFNRTHPFIKRDKKWFLQSLLTYCSYSLLFFLIIYNLIFYNLKTNNLSLICKNSVLTVIFIMVSMQYSVLINHQEALQSLIKYVKKDYDMVKNLPLDEQKIVEKYANNGMYVCKLWYYLAFIGFVAFPAKHIFLIVYHSYTSEFRLIPPYEFYYPGILGDIKDNIYVYFLIYIYLFLSSFYASVMYVAYVPLGPIMILHASGQLELVKIRIDNLFARKEPNEEIIKKKLECIVKQLQYVHSFVNLIMDVFKLDDDDDMTLKATTMILPVTVYQGLEALKQGEFSLEFVAFIFGSILLSTSPCYYSQLLMDKGEEVRIALYSCGWELRYDRSTRITLQILLQYAVHPIAVRTFFRTLCLEATADLFQQTYTIFNFLNTMW